MSVELKGIEQLVLELQRFPGGVRGGLSSALTRTRRGAVGPRGVISKFVRERYKIKAATVAKTITSSIDRRNLKLNINLAGGVIGVNRFGSPNILKRGKGVRFTVRQGGAGTTLKHAFTFGTGNTPRITPFFERRRGKITRIFSTAVASTLTSNEKAIEKVISDLFETRTREGLAFVLKKFTGEL